MTTQIFVPFEDDMDLRRLSSRTGAGEWVLMGRTPSRKYQYTVTRRRQIDKAGLSRRLRHNNRLNSREIPVTGALSYGRPGR